MASLTNHIQQLQKAIAFDTKKLKLSKIQIKITNLSAQTQNPDFWADNRQAQAIMKKLTQLQAKVEPWVNLEKDINDIQALAALNDQSLKLEMNKQIIHIEKQFKKLQSELQLNGPYDDHSAIVSIFAGAGGTDSQDWTQMLFRMYTRWGDKAGYKVQVMDESSGEEAGLKQITFNFQGPNAYGKLKGEQGVHRLVRLSPFNADNLRQTSFARVDVLPEIDQPDELEIDEKDIKVDVFRSGGHGGQSVNTTDSAVRVTHLPTGIVVSIQNERSQLQNKETALTILRSRLAQLKLEQRKQHLSEIKGPNQSAQWGNQIRSYVLHPYKQVKDLRTKYQTSNIQAILDGDLDNLIQAYLELNASL